MCKTIKAVTWNMRFVYNDGDGINNFIHRAGMIVDKIIKEKPDVVTFQEIVPEIYVLLERMLPEYMILGHFKGEDYVSCGGMFTAIRKESYDLIALETFWLSPTPYKPGTRFENQSPVPRMCVMTQIRNKESGEVVRVFDVHLDHISEEARVLGMECILKFLKEYNEKLKLPTIMMGDFNAEPDSKAIELCNGTLNDVTDGIKKTFHDFGRDSQKIDYIFLSDEFNGRTEDVGIWDDCLDGIYLSDHFPVWAKIKIC